MSCRTVWLFSKAQTSRPMAWENAHPHSGRSRLSSTMSATPGQYSLSARGHVFEPLIDCAGGVEPIAGRGLD